MLTRVAALRVIKYAWVFGVGGLHVQAPGLLVGYVCSLHDVHVAWALTIGPTVVNMYTAAGR